MEPLYYFVWRRSFFVYVRVFWILRLALGATQVSIELTSESGLTLDRADLLSEDRITIIDSLGTCGLSSPSASVAASPRNRPHEGTGIVGTSAFGLRTILSDRA